MAAHQKQTSKTAVESAYPSPADEIKHVIVPASPAEQSHHRHSFSDAGRNLPSIKEILQQQQPISPSTSPHIAPAQYGLSPGSLSMPSPMTGRTSGNAYPGNLYNTADPQLFPERNATATTLAYQHQPLFPSFSSPLLRGRTLVPQITPRRRKHTPVRAPASSLLEPPRQFNAGLWARATADPEQWFQDRRDEDMMYWPKPESTRRSSGIGMVRGLSSQGATAPAASSTRRAIARQDSGSQGLPLKRKAPGSRTSPRDQANSSFFSTVLDEPVAKTPKPAHKRNHAPAQPVAKKVKPNPELPDRAYELYKDTTPDVSSLDKGVKFTASWSGKPLNLDNDPDRDLLHEEEIRLASKLALSCARYLYLKRRFYSGRLEFARKGQLYNINAAQQQCKGADVHGITGADVNKTSSMWKAFSSVGWLNVSHMDPYL